MPYSLPGNPPVIDTLRGMASVPGGKLRGTEACGIVNEPRATPIVALGDAQPPPHRPRRRQPRQAAQPQHHRVAVQVAQVVGIRSSSSVGDGGQAPIATWTPRGQSV